VTAGHAGVIALAFVLPLPEDTKARSKLSIETMVLAVLVAVLGGVLYHELNKGMEAVQAEHRQTMLVKRAHVSPAVAAPAPKEAPDAAADQ
jgi:hypothetical protein